MEPYKLKGGAILLDTSLGGCGAVINMIQEPTSAIKLLTISSLKGFIFTLNVPNNSLFRNFKFLGNAPITSFIIKFTVIDALGDSYLPDCEGKEKMTESSQTFYDEAKIQNQIWIDSAVGSKPIFTPSIADFSLFHPEQAFKLLDIMLNKMPPSDRSIPVFEYLKDLFDPSATTSYDLGLILMPNIVNSIGLTKYLKQPDSDIYTAQCKSIANVINLFVFKKVIHFDLHGDNAMIQTTAEGDINSFIIDFGRATDISNDAMPGSSYLQTAIELNEARTRSREFAKIFDDCIRDGRCDDSFKVQLIQNIMEYLKLIDHSQNDKIFGNISGYQMEWMDWLIETAKGPIKDVWLLCIYNKVLHDHYIDVGSSKPLLQRSTVKAYVREQKLIDFTRGIDTFYCTDPRLSPTSPAAAAAAATGNFLVGKKGYAAAATATVPSPPSPSSFAISFVPGHSAKRQRITSCDRSPTGVGCAVMGGKKRRRTKRTKRKKARTRGTQKRMRKTKKRW